MADRGGNVPCPCRHAPRRGYPARISGRQSFRVSLLFPCLALLCPRLGGAHLHLCLDGQAAPVSVHACEPGHSDAHHDDPAHSDQDVSLVSDALTPLSKWFADLPTLLAVLVLILAARAQRPAARNGAGGTGSAGPRSSPSTARAAVLLPLTP